MRSYLKLIVAITASIVITAKYNFLALPIDSEIALVRPASAQQSVIAPVFSADNLAYRNAKYSGYTQDGLRYELAANSAVPNADGDRISVDEPRVALEMTNGNRIAVQGAIGTFEPKTSTLTIYSAVLTSLSGNTVRMAEAIIDMRENSVVSEKPVQVRYEDQTIRANRLQLRKQGIAIVDDGMIIRPTSIIFFDHYAIP